MKWQVAFDLTDDDRDWVLREESHTARSGRSWVVIILSSLVKSIETAAGKTIGHAPRRTVPRICGPV